MRAMSSIETRPSQPTPANAPHASLSVAPSIEHEDAAVEVARNLQPADADLGGQPVVLEVDARDAGERLADGAIAEPPDPIAR